jgi:short-subunit dehydrogenase
MPSLLITGATKGIGWECVKKFVSNGYDVAFCSRSEEDLRNKKKEILSKFPERSIVASVCDVRSKEAVLAFAKLSLKALGSIDVLINNAGIFIPGGLLTEEEGNLENMIETNLYSAYHLTRAVLPTMLQKGKGHVFTLCSIASFMAYPNGGSYAISKFALLGFTKCLRQELLNSRIKVTAVMPGATWSASWEGADLPFERLMPAEDIAELIYSASQLSDSTVVEEIIVRPQKGDL